MRERGGPAATALRFAVLVVASALAVAPLATVLGRALLPGPGGASALEGLARALQGPGLRELGNSLLVSGSTVVVVLVVGAPAAYVLSRGRGRLVSAWALVLFCAQSVPVIVFLVPLFVTLAGLGLVDDLQGLVVVYVGIALAVGIWMLTASLSTVPVELEEAAWLDGTSLLGGFVRIVLPNAAPGLVSTALFTFLTAWNEYLIAVVWLRSDDVLTLAVGLQGGRSPALALLVLIPPALLFVLLNRFFSLGGVAGALTGR